VALSSTSIVIGGESETAGGETYAGHVYLYSASTDDLALTLSSPTPAYDGYFGERVALSGTTLVVGGGYATAGGFEEAGQVFSFKSTTGALLHSYVSPSPQTAGQFGWSVAASGSEIAIGAPDETANGDSYGGYVYLY